MLDWPSLLSDVKVPEYPVLPPDVLVYDLYFNILVFAPPDSAHWDNIIEKPLVPIAPADDVPPIWRYQYPLLAFRRLCLRKGMLPTAFGYYQALIIFSFRGFAALWYIWSICSCFVDYPRHLFNVLRLYVARRHPYVGFPVIVADQLYDDDWWWYFDGDEEDEVVHGYDDDEDGEDVDDYDEQDAHEEDWIEEEDYDENYYEEEDYGEEADIDYDDGDLIVEDLE